MMPDCSSRTDVIQEGCAELSDGRPDGSEQAHIHEVEADLEKYSSKVKQLKNRNAQVTFIPRDRQSLSEK